MGEETQSKQSICVFCKKPITKEQRPSIQLRSGQQAHIECWIKYRDDASKPN
ncbi:MAG TPA: hypothetical protein VE866_08935 [Candidatus Binatia bacterium]|nr:hypothetical protein [Candidatus Binatia bacterium]